MKLRLAKPADVKLLQYWDAKQHVIDSGGGDDDYDWARQVARSVPWQEILIAEEGGRPIGMLVIIDPAEEETHYWGACAPNLRALDIWIGEETDLGRGYGTQMMHLALNHCFAAPEVNAVIIDPLAKNERACQFYERLGFNLIEKRYFGDDYCCVYRLDRADFA